MDRVRDRVPGWRRNGGPVLMILAIGACASSPRQKNAESSAEAAVAKAATTPLSDVNLVRTKIPPVLIEAHKAPYAPPPDASCAGIAAEVQALDAALGPDLDTPETPADPSLVARGAGVVGEVAVSALQGAAQSVVPFRSWLRKLTGAERHSRAVAAAIAAGSVRRAFLKGLGQSQGCGAPAAPSAGPGVGAAR